MLYFFLKMHVENLSSPNPVPEPVSSPVSAPVSTQQNNRNWLIPLFSVLVLLLLSSTGYLYYQNQQLKSMLTSYQPQASPDSSATADPTVDWKILKTTNLYLKYPNTLIGCAQNDPVFENLSVRTTENCNSSGASENILGISKISNPAENQVYQYLKGLNIGDTKPGMTEGEKMAGVQYKRGKDLAIGDLTAKTYFQSSNQNVQNNSLTIYSYLTSPENELYFVSQSYTNVSPNKYNINFSNTFDQILSTFKFIDQNTLAQIPGWKYYTNNDLSFQYPGEWKEGQGRQAIVSDIAGAGITVFTKDMVMYNECMKLDKTDTVDDKMVKYYSYAYSTEACSNQANIGNYEVWITKAGGDGYQPGIIYMYNTTIFPKSFDIFKQILSTFKFL